MQPTSSDKLQRASFLRCRKLNDWTYQPQYGLKVQVRHRRIYYSYDIHADFVCLVFIYVQT